MNTSIAGNRMADGKYSGSLNYFQEKVCEFKREIQLQFTTM